MHHMLKDRGLDHVYNAARDIAKKRDKESFPTVGASTVGIEFACSTAGSHDASIAVKLQWYPISHALPVSPYATICSGDYDVLFLMGLSSGILPCIAKSKPTKPPPEPEPMKPPHIKPKTKPLKPMIYGLDFTFTETVGGASAKRTQNGVVRGRAG